MSGASLPGRRVQAAHCKRKHLDGVRADKSADFYYIAA
jgi:hypothetical protein